MRGARRRTYWLFISLKYYSIFLIIAIFVAFCVIRKVVISCNVTVQNSGVLLNVRYYKNV